MQRTMARSGLIFGDNLSIWSCYSATASLQVGAPPYEALVDSMNSLWEIGLDLWLLGIKSWHLVLKWRYCESELSELWKSPKLS
jgi:hypothetical protein